MTRYVRVEPDPREKATAAAVAVAVGVGVGVFVFYLARVAMSREELPPRESGEEPRAIGPGG